MTRDRFLAGAALAAIAALGAVVVMVFWDGGGSGVPEPTVASPEGIEAYADLDPYRVEFGDTVTARVEVTLDRSRVDPDSVRVRAAFAPWKPVGPPTVVRRDGKQTTYLETRYKLRCLESSCVTPQDSDPQDFDPARVSYASRDEGTDETETRTLQARWPQLLVTARYAPPSSSTSGQPPANWEADLVSLPAASYRFGPWPLAALLAGGAVLLAAAAWAIVRAARPRRVAAPIVMDAPTGSTLTPLQYALALLEDASRVNGSGDQRRALELVADGLAGRGDSVSARTARGLAWSRPVPRIEETRGVARHARKALGEEVEDRADST